MKFRRKSDPQAETADAPEAPESAVPGEGAEAAPSAARTAGPRDVSEVELVEDDPTRVDLGGMLVKGRPGIELRLQVDEASQRVAAVMLVAPEGAVELRPFAAPRNGGIWDDIRRQIAAETARRGGTATEAEGPFGTELRVAMPVQLPDGKTGNQPSRVLGIEGPRWLLRATLLGRPALDPDSDSVLVQALDDVVVVRGAGPMSPGEPLPLVVPANAKPVARPEAGGSAPDAG